MKAPSHSTPAYVAARVRKILAAQGWPMHKMTGRYRAFYSTQTGTEGYSVSRVGCSKSIAIHYSGSYSNGSSRMLPHGVAADKVAQARDLLRSLGYRVDDIGWITCDTYGDR